MCDSEDLFVQDFSVQRGPLCLVFLQLKEEMHCIRPKETEFVHFGRKLGTYRSSTFGSLGKIILMRVEKLKLIMIETSHCQIENLRFCSDCK